MLDLWLGDSGLILLCLLPRLLLFIVGGVDLMGALCVIVYDKTHVGQGYTDVCPCVGAETGATDLVRLGEVSDFIPLGA